MPDEQGVEQNSPSALAQAIASSPEAQEQIEQQAQEPESGTPQKPETQGQGVQEESKIPYSRLKEVVDEKNYWREMAMKNNQIPQQPQQQFQQPQQDPYAGMSADEEKFMRMIDARAERIAQQKIQQLSPVIDAGRIEIARMQVQQFRTQHPDVRPNSHEEAMIAEKIQAGYLPEDAYRSVVWDRKVGEKTERISQENKQKIEAKKSANLEQRSIPQGASPPTKEKLTLRQRIERQAQELGI